MPNEIIGKKIKEVRYLTDKELNAEAWSTPCIALVLEDGTLIYPSQDTEGNGPGWLFGCKDNRGFGLA